MRYMVGGNPVKRPESLSVGDHVLLSHGGHERNRWTVQAQTEHFTAFVRQATFHPKGTLEYCVADWRSGVRGPCDIPGQGFGDGTYSKEQCEEMLAGFEYDRETDPEQIRLREEALAAGENGWPSPTCYDLEVSQRNNVPLAGVLMTNGETF